MPNVAVRRVRDLDEPARAWIVRLFGRPLDEDEEITFSVFPPHAAPPTAERQAPAAPMDAILDKAAANPKAVSGADHRAAVEEAMERVRRWKTWPVPSSTAG